MDHHGGRHSYVWVIVPIYPTQWTETGTTQCTVNGTSSTTIDTEPSTLNPEVRVPSFNPTNFRLSLQEIRLFDQLQNIEVQVQTLKRQMEHVLTPLLQTITQQLMTYQLNPHLVQAQYHFSTYYQLLSQQQALNNQLLISQQTYQQLLSQQQALTNQIIISQLERNKLEQYRVGESMPISSLNEVDQVGLNSTGGDQPVTDAEEPNLHTQVFVL